MKEWIDVKDSVPVFIKGKNQDVIVSGIKDGERYVYYAETYAYGNVDKPEDIFSVPGWGKMNVTHWMPFPAPPDL